MIKSFSFLFTIGLFFSFSIVYPQSKSPATSLSSGEKTNKNIGPAPQFQELANALKNQGYIPDPPREKRMRSYKSLLKNDIHYFNSKQFYKVTTINTELFWWTKTTNSRADSINFELFEKAKSIWAYTYRKNINTRIIPDGVIEQWEFETKEMALKALENLESEEVYPLPFFNTEPRYFALNNYLFLFYSRASESNGMQENFQKQLKRICQDKK